MTPENRIKREILAQAMLSDVDLRSQLPESLDLHSDEGVASAYGAFIDLDAHWDYENEFRSGTVETGIECDYSRHYEAKAVATKMDDGTWIGWTYWYGGGKHGEPGAFDWMPYAYELTCVEEEKVVKVQSFTKVETVSP